MLDNYFSAYSPDGLRKMHLAVVHAFETDEATPSGQEKPFGVRQYDDWKRWSDGLEAELAKRKALFLKVPW
jgi:hypothetical protein